MTLPKPDVPPRPASKIVQSMARGRALRLVGWTAVILGLLFGVLALAGQSDTGSALDVLPGWESPLRKPIYALLGGLLAVLGRFLLLRGRRHLAPVLRSIDGLPPDQRIVLFLRSFTDDDGFARQQEVDRTLDYGATTRTEEEQLRRALAPFGRMVALGQPGDTLPQAGATRLYASDEDWQNQVLAGLDRAGLVLLATGPGPGLRWEVETLIARDQPERLVVIVSRDSQQYQEFRTSMGDRFPRGLPDYRPRSPLRSVATATYTRAAIWFDADWTPHLRHLDGRDADGDVGNWVESTFPRAMAPVYTRAGMAAPASFAARVRRLAPGRLARNHAPASKPPAAPDEPLGGRGVWQARRVRTGGLDHVLLVSDGVEDHTVEYRAYPRDRAVLRFDGRRVARGPRCLDHEFRLGRRGPAARLVVTDEPDIRLSVAGQQVYRLRQAAPGSDSFLEHRAAAIRAALLQGEPEFGGPFRVRLGVTPDISRRDLRVPRAHTGHGSPADPIIAALTTRSDYGVARTWFTDRAVHIRHTGETTVVPYTELAAVPVTADYLILHLLGEIHLPGQAENIAKTVNRVKDAVVSYDAGPDEPPPIALFARRGDARVARIRSACRPLWTTLWRVMWLPLGTVGALAVTPHASEVDAPWPLLFLAGFAMGVGFVVALVLVMTICVWAACGYVRLVSAPRRRFRPS